MVACARLGLSVRYLGAVGDDERGRIQLESLRAEGIDTSDVIVRAGCETQSAYIVIDRSTGERTMLWKRIVSSMWKRIDLNVLRTCNILRHISSKKKRNARLHRYCA